MSSKSCSTCLRAIQRQTRIFPQSKKPTFPPVRTFTTTRRALVELPEPNQGIASSIPPVTPQRAEGIEKKYEYKPLSESEKQAHKTLLSGRKIGGITETYTAYGATEQLYKECCKQADYSIPQASDAEAEVPKTEEGEDLGVGGGWWHDELGLKPTFSTWSQVTMLHIYILSSRFRCFPPAVCRIWQQHLLDHFFYDMENKMVINHGMVARGTRNKYLKDVFVQWRGVLAAYDEGLAKNDAVLAGALWRNVFKASEDVDIKKLAMIVSFMRRSLSALEKVPDEKVMMSEVWFGSPADEEEVVARRSKELGEAGLLNTRPAKSLPAKAVPGKKK